MSTKTGQGQQWHNADERLLTGVIKCARCHSHMFGGGGRKKGKYIPYYVCSKRFNDHECEQDYVRADLLEATVVQDIKTMFRDKPFMERIWGEVNRRLGEERPDVEQDTAKVEAQIAKTRASLDRYFVAFEARTMSPELCGKRVEELNARLHELEAERRHLEARRQRLELPALDHSTLSGLVDNFENVMAQGTNPQRKHLVQRLVSKVLVHDKEKVEVWYKLPDSHGFENRNNCLPSLDDVRTFCVAVA